MKIFISFSSIQIEIAEKMKSILESHFENQVEIFISSENILPSDKWQEKIQEGLNECDAILSIITPKFLESSWLYIEWSAFWLNKKRIYLTYLDKIELSDLIDPMRDYQITNLSDGEDVFKLLKSIATLITDKPDTTKDFATKTALELNAQYLKFIEKEKQLKFMIYKENISLLPNDDLKKKEIFEFFFNQRDFEFCKEIFKKINQYSIETQILKELFAKQEYELIEYIFEVADSRDALLEILKDFANKGMESHPVAEKILTYLKESNTILRQYAEYFVRNQNIDNNVLAEIIANISNNAELKKLALTMISSGVFNSKMFGAVVEKFFLPSGNRAELKYVLFSLFEQDEYPRSQIETYVERMARISQKETAKLLDELIGSQKDFVVKMINEKGIITNQELLNSLMSKL